MILVPTVMRPRFECTDGGRAAAGFAGTAGDCACRAIAIATGKLYREVYDGLSACCALLGQDKKPADRGMPLHVTRMYLGSLGWGWVEQNRKMRMFDLPGGRIIVAVPKHLVAVIDNCVFDSGDSWRGARRVYGYFSVQS